MPWRRGHNQTDHIIEVTNRVIVAAMSCGWTRPCPGTTCPPLEDPSIELGSIYSSAAVLDGLDQRAVAADGPALDDPRTPTGRLGTRAAHLPVERDGTPMSIHDVFGDGFVLLTGPDWSDDQVDLVEPDGRFGPAFGIGSGGAVLTTTRQGWPTCWTWTPRRSARTWTR